MLRNSIIPPVLIASSTLLLALIGACGGDAPTGPGDDGSDDPVVDPLAIEQKLQNVDLVLEAVMPPPDTPFATRDLVGELRNVAQVTVQQPDVITTRVDPSSQTLQIDYVDGTSILVANSRPPRPTETAAERLDSAISTGAMQAGPPGSKQAAWISIDGGASVGAEVGSMLSEAGYDVSNPTGTLDDMRQLKNLGALYLDTHGVVWIPVLEVQRDEEGNVVGKVDGQPLYALQTMTEVDVAEFANLQGELERGEVIVKYSQHASTGKWMAHLGITERFIARHWTFDNAVVMIHACNGGRGPVEGDWDCFGLCEGSSPYDPTALRTAILGKGADVVVAFDNITWPTNARPSILYLFDRLLGANTFDPEVVPSRPFDIGQVMSGMQQKDLLSFQLGNADVNVTFDVADNRVTLAPSIQRMEIVDDRATGHGTLTLHGTFGGDPGEVEVGGQAATLETWTADRVVAQVPFEGAGSSGQVVSLKPDAVASNQAPLTEWEGTLTATVNLGQGSLQAEAEMDILFRADVHPYREQIDGPTTETSVRSYMSPAAEGEVRGSGNYTVDGGTLRFFGETPFEFLTRAEIDAGGPNPGGTESTFGGFVDLDPEANQVQVCFSMLGSVNTAVDTEQGPIESEAQVVLLPPGLFDGFVNGLGCLFLPLQGDYSIPSGSTEFNADEVHIRLDWTIFTPTSAPDHETSG